MLPIHTRFVCRENRMQNLRTIKSQKHQEAKASARLRVLIPSPHRMQVVSIISIIISIIIIT